MFTYWQSSFRSVRIGIAAAVVLVVSLGLVLASPSWACADHYKYEVVEEFYDYEGNWVPLRQGDSSWGYTHIEQKHGWGSYERQQTDDTITYPDSIQEDGTAKTYRREYDLGCGATATWKVVVEYGSSTKGIITSYSEGS